MHAVCLYVERERAKLLRKYNEKLYLHIRKQANKMCVDAERSKQTRPDDNVHKQVSHSHEVIAYCNYIA